MGFSVCVLAASLFVTAVLVVPAVLVPSSDVNVIDEVALSESECEIVESQTSSLSIKREASLVEYRKDMNAEGTPEKTPPASRN